MTDEKEILTANQSRKAPDYPSKFLKAIFDGHLVERGLELELRCFHKDEEMPIVRRFYKSLADFKAAWQEMVTLNKRGYNVHFGVLARDPKNNHELPDPPLFTCLWADLDVGPRKPHKTIADALGRIKTFAKKPTIVVLSGHGIHAYWRLKKATRIKTDEAKRLLRALAVAVGGDLQSAEPARLLRMPGTINWKESKNLLQMPNPSDRQERTR
jgi:RepB DNA-primase from phage plasmid